MINTTTGKRQTGLQILRFQVWHLIENLGRAEARRKEVEHIAHTDSHAAHARATPTLLGVHRDAIK